jgi:hypothetical protein
MRPLSFTLTGGQAHDSQSTEDLLDTPHTPLVVVGDKGYDSQRARQQIKRHRCVTDHPKSRERPREGILPQAHLPMPARDRKFLLPDQGLAAHRNAIR